MNTMVACSSSAATRSAITQAPAAEGPPKILSSAASRLAICGELIEHPPPIVPLHLHGKIAGVLHAPRCGRCQNELGAIRGHTGATLGAQIVRHDKRHAVAGHGNAGVAAGCLNEAISRTDFAARFGVANHGQHGPILYRAAGVVPFELAQDNHTALGRTGFGKALQAYERRIADRVIDGAKSGRVARSRHILER
jgi:hypothetical protein